MSESAKLRRLKERMDRQDARDAKGGEQDQCLRALNIHEIKYEEAQAQLICAEMKCKLLQKGLDEYRDDSNRWKAMYYDLLDDFRTHLDKPSY